MKQKDAVNAYISAKKLNSLDVTPMTAQTIFELFRALQPAWDFQLQEEQKIFAKHPKLDVGTLSIKMENPDDLEEKANAEKEITEINQELKDLANVETVINFQKRNINAMFDKNIKVSGEDIANLDPFITFVYGPMDK